MNANASIFCIHMRVVVLCVGGGECGSSGRGVIAVAWVRWRRRVRVKVTVRVRRWRRKKRRGTLSTRSSLNARYRGMPVETPIRPETATNRKKDTTEKPTPQNSMPTKTNMATTSTSTSSVMDVHAALVVRTATKKFVWP